MLGERFDFRNAAGLQLSGRLEEPHDGIRGYALFAHCFTCSKNVAAATRISRGLVARGFGVLRFDFTGLGNSEGDFANTNFSSNTRDIIDAASAMAASGRPADLLVGHSLGGAAVLSAAHAIPSARAVVSVAAPSDPGHVTHLLSDDVRRIEEEGEAEVDLAGRRFKIKKQFLEDLQEQQLGRRIHELRRALLILHGPRDAIVSIDHARHIFEAALHPKSFVSLDEADHLLSRPVDGDYAAEIISAWSSRYLRPLPSSSNARESVAVTSLAKLAQRIEAGPHVLRGDEPRELGGDDTGPTPYEYLLASLGTCTSITLRMYAARKSWPLDKVHVELN
ncbi:MAG: alpha/beta fold hydrolase, partial [Myxococcales bacterium]|nr:alpha/beta fold hydrolase [Myxococcales bacterium]